MSATPETGPDPLDIESPNHLLRWLEEQELVAPSEKIKTSVLAGGVSNRTVRVQAGGRDLIVKQALSRLRVEDEWFSPTDRILTEFAALEVYGSLLPGQVPEPVRQDRERNIIAMAAVPEPHANWKTRLLQGCVDPGSWQEFGRMLAHVHDKARPQIDRLPARLQSKMHFHSLRLDPYYLVSGLRVPRAADFMQDLVNAATNSRNTLVHGDYSPKNVLLQDRRLWLLDFEVSHVGTPWFDVGFALTHALAKALWSPLRRTQFLQGAEAFWDGYRQRSGPALAQDGGEAAGCRHTAGCLLARAVGRSRLEYLNDAQLDRQCALALGLMANLPSTIPDLIREIAGQLGKT